MQSPSTFPFLAVGHDGTPASRPALAWAAAVARQHAGARLDLVHAVSLPPIPVHQGAFSVDELLDRHERVARGLLAAAAAELARPGLETRIVLRRWLAAETLIEHARDEGIGLLVVGQHGGRAGRLLLGSVSAEVARDAAVPVVVVRGERPSPPRRVLLAADGSPASLRAAASAARWFPDAEVVALHLRERSPAVDLGALSSALTEAGLDAARLELRVSDAAPARALLEVAAEEAIDLVAAGRRGHSAWSERVLGGVSEKLLQLAPCPVLVAH